MQPMPALHGRLLSPPAVTKGAEEDHPITQACGRHIGIDIDIDTCMLLCQPAIKSRRAQLQLRSPHSILANLRRCIRPPAGQTDACSACKQRYSWVPLPIRRKA